ncbi:IclR family transcriptional regulator [Alphaproteobacteria bacterium KMM 3653]|uniref:IclR family transcriptional regulator n=1 Tax=Harenicola maris TaxID=2841044 RepID=A0AAP2CX40_9RHOB|nr:IclR family transcriptional regulator [Harenicola maris]
MDAVPDKKPKAKKEQRGVSSIDVGGRILGVFGQASKPLTLSVLSDMTGIAAGQLHPYLVSFINMGMVEKTGRGLYQLGPFALHLGLARLRKQNAHRMAIERVGALSESLQMMVSVAVWGAQGPTITYIQEYERSLHINIRVGGVYSLPMTATGLVFCAFLPESTTAPLVEREFTDSDSSRRSFYTIDKLAFRENVEKTRAQGFGTTQDMPIPGITAISGPVFDHSGGLQLCVAAIGPSDAISIDKDATTVRELLAFTEQLSSDLGYSEASRTD